MKIRAAWDGMDQKKRLWLVFLSTSLFLEVFFIIRAFYGCNTADEMFYISTVERFYRGERMLIDEWQPSQQLCAFLIYPLYCVLRAVLGSTEGIVMAYRFSFLVYHFAVSVICFARLGKKGQAAVAAVLLYLIYVPFGFFTLSYNTIEMTILPLLCLCLYSKPEHKRWEYVLYGGLAAAVVLANPFALLLYLIYGGACLAGSLAALWKKEWRVPGVLRFSGFLWMSLGAFAVAVLFFGFVLSRGSVQEVLTNLPHILTDPEHEQGIQVYQKKVRRYFYLCFKNYKYMFYGLGILLAAILLDRGRYKRAGIYLMLGMACTLPYIIYDSFVFDYFPMNYQMTPIAFLGLVAYLLTKNRDKRMFFGWYLPTVLFTMIVQLASNTGMVAISAAYGMCIMPAVCFLWDCLMEIRKEQPKRWKRWMVSVSVAVLLAAQTAGMLYVRLIYVPEGNQVWDWDAKLEQGPLKGIYTTQDAVKEYDQVLEELESLDITQEDQLLVVGVAPWIYLCTDAGYGTYSAWQVHEESTQLIDYYELHPDKTPTVIYMIQWGEDFLASALAQPFLEQGYEVIYLEQGIVMQAPDR